MTARRRSSRTPDDTDTLTASAFETAPPFTEDDDSGSVHLGPFERLYESLFAEALEGGEISPEERERLNLAAAALGLDPSRVAKLEAALMDAWESNAEQTLVDPRQGTLADDDPTPLNAPPEEEEPPTLARIKRADHAPPVEIPFAELHDRWQSALARDAVDDAWRIAAVLVQRGAATQEERALWESHRIAGPIRPASSLDAEAWTTLLLHPEQERTTGEIFGVIASAALVGRVSAMRRDGTLPRLDPESQQNPAATTLAAVRALSWAAATLGMRMPPAYVAPQLDASFEIVTVIPPSTRIGARALSGMSAAQLAFACGRHLAWFREEHFVCTLVPSVTYLETIFYAALLLGAPALQLPDELHERARVFSQAIVPCLEKPQMERLQRLVARFLARGGRTHLRRWAQAAEWTSCRAGLLLCGDLTMAANVLSSEPGGEARITELETFWASDAAGELRRRMGVALR